MVYPTLCGSFKVNSNATILDDDMRNGGSVCDFKSEVMLTMESYVFLVGWYVELVVIIVIHEGISKALNHVESPNIKSLSCKLWSCFSLIPFGICYITIIFKHLNYKCNFITHDLVLMLKAIDIQRFGLKTTHHGWILLSFMTFKFNVLFFL